MSREEENPGAPRGAHAGATKENRLAVAAPRHVAIVRALSGVGDMLCAVPAFRALRAALPDARISLIGLPETAVLLDRFRHYVDDLIPFPGFPGMLEGGFQLARFPRQIASLQRRNFDVVIQMHGNGSISNIFSLLLGGSLTAGCHLPGSYSPDERYFLPYPDDEPEIWRNLHLLQFLGIAPQGDNLEFPMIGSDWVELAEVEEARDLEPEGYVCIHPGASDPARRWAPEHFAAVADTLATTGLRVVLTGTEHERPLTRAVAAAMRAPSLDLAGRTTIGAFAALLWDARLLVCNDTGVSHLADALQLPSVVIFAAYPDPTSDPLRWAPLDTRLHRAVCPSVVSGQVSPPPTTMRRHEGSTADPLQDITVDAIAAALRQAPRQVPVGAASAPPRVFYV
jgi:ADP-heptose:LPS heptosyltransferase